jgi:hypothetical protein
VTQAIDGPQSNWDCAFRVNLLVHSEGSLADNATVVNLSSKPASFGFRFGRNAQGQALGPWSQFFSYVSFVRLMLITVVSLCGD